MADHAIIYRGRGGSVELVEQTAGTRYQAPLGNAANFAFQDAVETQYAHTMDNVFDSNSVSSNKPQLYETEFSITDSSSSATLDYRGNSILFQPLPTLSTANTRPRVSIFAERLARIRRHVLSSGKHTGSTQPAAGDRGYESASSTSSATPEPDINTSEGKFVDGMKDHWFKLRQQRMDVLNILDELAGKRAYLQEVRRQKNDIDGATIQAFRRKLYKTDPDLMEQRLQTAERTGLDIEKAEQTLETLLDSLNSAEREVELLERRFYSQFSSDLVTYPSKTISPRLPRPSSQSPSSVSLLGISHDRPGLFHPLYLELREAFQHIQLARETLHNQAYRRFQIGPQQLALSGEFFALLKDIEDRESKGKKQLDLWLRKFDELQASCVKTRVMPRSAPFFRDSRGYHPRIEDDPSLELASDPVDLQTCIRPLYSILLSKRGHLLRDKFPRTSREALKWAVSIPKNDPRRSKSISEAIQEHGIDTLLLDGDLEDKNDYINRWLLHRLRTSAMEVEIFRSVFDTVLSFVNTDRWQFDVLVFWSRDRAVVTPTPANQSAICDLSSVGTLERFEKACIEVQSCPPMLPSGELLGECIVVESRAEPQDGASIVRTEEDYDHVPQANLTGDFEDEQNPQNSPKGTAVSSEDGIALGNARSTTEKDLSVSTAVVAKKYSIAGSEESRKI